MAGYDHLENAVSPPDIPGLLVTRRLRVEGFLIHDYEDEWEAAEAELGEHIASGAITPVHHVTGGLQQAPAALIGLLKGANIGECLVSVGRV